jgi:hypothetical protein
MVWPAASAASDKARPKPLLTPVMKNVWGMISPFVKTTMVAMLALPGYAGKSVVFA